MASANETTRESTYGFFSFAQYDVILLVDSYTKWIELEIVKPATADKVISFLRSFMNRFGLPDSICSDNGPQFTSYKFIEFCHLNKIVTLKSPPYHPESNGTAERAVQIVKNRWKIFTGSKFIKA